MWPKITAYMISCFNVDTSSITCTWIFIGEEGSRLLIKVDDIIFTGPATVNLKSDDGNSLTQISSLNSRFMYRKCSFCQTCHIFANYFTMFFQCFTILTSFNRRWSVDFWARQRRSSRCTVYQ